MNIKINFLGTGSMIPTPERNHLGILIQNEGKSFLFDCGENIQKQIRKKKLPFGRINKIFISHWHGDHTLGLGGLIQTLNNTENLETIYLYGPKKSKTYLKHILESSIFDLKIEIKVKEIAPKLNEIIYEDEELIIEAVKLEHGVPCLGYILKIKDRINIDKNKIKRKFPELINNPLLARIKLGLTINHKGKKISLKEIGYIKKGITIGLIFDTRPCNGTEYIAKNSDYLISESTLMYNKHHKNAIETNHMTAKEIAEISQRHNIQKLYLTHFSQRYKKIDELISEAKEIFPETEPTVDLQTITIKKYLKKEK